MGAQKKHSVFTWVDGIYFSPGFLSELCLSWSQSALFFSVMGFRLELMRDIPYGMPHVSFLGF